MKPAAGVESDDQPRKIHCLDDRWVLCTATFAFALNLPLGL